MQPAEEEAAAEEKSVEEQKAEDRPADKVRGLVLALQSVLSVDWLWKHSDNSCHQDYLLRNVCCK